MNVIVPNAQAGLHLNYLTGLLNSKLLFKWFNHRAKKRGANLKINGNVLQRAPICILDLKKPDQRKQHDRMVQFVEAMLSIQQQLAAAANETERAHYESKAAGLDRQIDELTYDLYGLIEEERALVQAS